MSLRTWHVPEELLDSFQALPTRQTNPGESGKRPALSFPAVTDVQLNQLLIHLKARGERISRLPHQRFSSALIQTATRLSDPDNVRRRMMIDLVAQFTGRSSAMLEEGLSFFLSKLTVDGINQTMRSAVEDVAELDDFFVRSDGRRVRARGPGLCVQFLASNTPWSGGDALVAAVLAKSACIFKLSGYEPVFTGLFAQELEEVDPEIGGVLAALHWEHADERLRDQALAESDTVVVYGETQTAKKFEDALLERMRQGTVRVVTHDFRFSAAFLGPEARVDKQTATGFASKLARDVAMEDQEGCLSPRAAFLIVGGDLDNSSSRVSVEGFALLVADALEQYEIKWPRREVTPAEANRIQQARGAAELGGATLLMPKDSTRWTVVIDSREEFHLSPTLRYLPIIPVNSVQEAIDFLHPMRNALSTIAVDGFGKQEPQSKTEVKKGLGPFRICSIGEMQRPPAGWRNSVESDLQSLLYWEEHGADVSEEKH